MTVIGWRHVLGAMGQGLVIKDGKTTFPNSDTEKPQGLLALPLHQVLSTIH